MELSSIRTSGQRYFIFIWILLCVPVLIYGLVLATPIPGSFGLAFRYGVASVIGFVLFLLVPAYRIPGWAGILCSLSLTLVLFWLPLSGLWNSGTSVDSIVIGGLLPYSDALRHLPGGLNILNGNELIGGAASKPLFPGFVSSILFLTRQNSQLTLAVIAAITAIAAFLFTREIQHHKGTTIAIFALMIIFLYQRRFGGTYMTENLGLILGLLACSALFRAAIEKDFRLYAFGAFLMTLAMSARPATVLVVPAILIWGLLHLKNKGTSIPRYLTLVAGAIMLAILLNIGVTRSLGTAPDQDSAGMSATLYGTIVGNHARQLQRDYPDATRSELPLILWQALQKNPGKLRAVIAAGYREYFNMDQSALGFGFIINDDQNPLTRRLRHIFFFFGIAGFIICIFKRKKPEYSLLITLMLGILLSIPALQAHSSDNLRHHAATIPISALLGAIALLPVSEFFKELIFRPNRTKQSKSLYSVKPTYIMGFAVVVSCTILPIVIASTASRPDGGQIHCENGLTATLLEVSDGSRIDLIDDSLADQSHIPDIRLADFQAGLRKMNDLIRPEHFNELMNLTAGTTIFIDQDGWLIGESAQFPDQISMVWICERPRDSFFRYIDSIRSTSLRKP